MTFFKIIVLLVTWVSGIYILIRTEYIVREIGHNAWAEKHLGPGGTYTMWKGIAVILMIIGFVILLGDLDFILGPAFFGG